MATRFVQTTEEFNQEQNQQLRAGSFQTSGRRVYLFEGATVLVDIATNTIVGVKNVQGMKFDPMVAVKRIAYYLGFVNYEGERYELVIENNPFFNRLRRMFA